MIDRHPIYFFSPPIFLVVVFFEVAPLPAETLQTLNVMSFVCGLLTALVASMLLNGSYNEFSKDLDRWEGDTNYGLYGRLIMERDKHLHRDNVNYAEATYLLYMVCFFVQSPIDEFELFFLPCCVKKKCFRRTFPCRELVSSARFFPPLSCT